MTSVCDHPWLGGLFADDEASALWSAEAQLRHYADFEVALAQALAETGGVSQEQAAKAARTIKDQMPTPEALRTGTAHDGLPIPELIRRWRAAAGDAAEAVHTGATSQDVMDTALALTLQAACDLLAERLHAVTDALGALQRRFGAQPLMGRTRMQAALPITVADRIESWRAPLVDHVRRVETLRAQAGRLQLAGPVGTGASFGEDYAEIQRHMAQTLGLTVPDRCWHTDRTVVADLAGCLSLISGSLGKMGQDLCLMAQQGLDEIAIAGGGGSSAMPHKANPVQAELLVTLARYNATQLPGLHHALVHEQERSGSAWMLEWMILPQMSLATARGLSVAASLCAQITRMGPPD